MSKDLKSGVDLDVMPGSVYRREFDIVRRFFFLFVSFWFALLLSEIVSES